MNLTKDELLRNLKNVQEKYKDKIYKTFELNIYAMVSDVIDYLENEHFESSDCRVESSLTRSNPPLELENYLKRIQELELKEKQWIETEKDYRDEIKGLKKALNKTCDELVKMCEQTKCKDCHFVKEQMDCDNDCPVQGNLTSYDWKKWSFEE